MLERIITTGEIKMNINFDEPQFNYPNELRQLAANLINFIQKSAPRTDTTIAQAAEWNRCRSLAYTNIQQGILWAIEAECI